MIKYVIYKNNGGLVCHVKDSEGQEFYIDSYSKFDAFLKVLNRSEYNVIINGRDIILKNNRRTVILKDADVTLGDKYLSELKENIEDTINRKGFTDVSSKDKLNKKVTRKNKHVGKKIKIIALIILGTAIVINLAYFCMNESLAYKEDSTKSVIDTYEQDNSTIGVVEKSILPDIKDEQNDDIEIFKLDFDELSNTDKAKSTRENYYDLINKHAKRFGLDANLVLGIATQERGVHSSEIDTGGGIGLMQIQYSVWINETVEYFELNESTNEYEKKSLTITDEMLKNVDTNIEIGCIILQKCLLYSDYNIPVAVQMYNMGSGTLNKILKEYAGTRGLTEEEVLDNPEDNGWLEYRNEYLGDPDYLENVNKWIIDNEFTVTNVLTGEQVSIKFDNSKTK